MCDYKILLGGSLELEINSWDCAFNYTEHSPDAWYSDRETSVSITGEEADALVKALNDYLVSINQLKMAEQHDKLNQKIIEWMTPSA